MQNSKAKFIRLLALCFCVMFSGCLSARSKAPRIEVTTPSGTEFNQAGDVKTPPVVNTSKTSVEIPIPAQSQIVVTPATAKEPEKITVTVPLETKLTSTTFAEHIDGAQSQQPPSPTEIARGNAVQWAFIAGGIFLVAGLALVYLQHYKAAGFAFAGCFLVPTSARFLASDKALLLCIGLAAISATLVCAWYLITKKFDLFPKAKK